MGIRNLAGLPLARSFHFLEVAFDLAFRADLILSPLSLILEKLPIEDRVLLH